MTTRTYTIEHVEDIENQRSQTSLTNHEFSLIERLGLLMYALCAELANSGLFAIHQKTPQEEL